LFLLYLVSNRFLVSSEIINEIRDASKAELCELIAKRIVAAASRG